jgi:hypothetical protein
MEEKPKRKQKRYPEAQRLAKARYMERARKRGLVRVAVMIPESAREELHAYAEALREGAE